MKKLVFLAIIAAILIIINCGDDNGTNPDDEIIVLLTPGDTSVGFEDTLKLTAGVYNTTNRSIKWYVNGVLNGNSDVGTIVNNSDSAGYFIAPSSISTTDRMTVTIVSQVDTTKSAASSVLIIDPFKIYVSNTDGNDSTGTGTSIHPYKTITHGLTHATI